MSLEEIAKYAVVGKTGLKNVNLYKNQYAFFLDYPVPLSDLKIQLYISWYYPKPLLENINQSYVILITKDGSESFQESIPYILALDLLNLLLPFLEPVCEMKKHSYDCKEVGIEENIT